MTKKEQKRGADGKFQKKSVTTAGSPAGSARLDCNGNSEIKLPEEINKEVAEDEGPIPYEIARALELIEDNNNVRSVLVDDDTAVVVFTKKECLCNDCMKKILTLALDSNEIKNVFTAWIWRSWEPGKFTTESIEYNSNDEWIKFSDLRIKTERLKKYIEDDELVMRMNIARQGFIIMADSEEELREKVMKVMLG